MALGERSQAPTLESEAIPLQPNPLYDVSTNVDNTAEYEIVEKPIKMKQNPVYDATIQSDATTQSDDATIQSDATQSDATQSDATQVQSDVVYEVFNDEHTSQVENEGMEVTESQQYDYIQI